jgi:competence ComEA-like helix-hairpin-helix protein
VAARVPETRAARALVCAALFACALWPLRPPAHSGALALVRDAGACRLASAAASGPRCACAETPVEVRAVLALPSALNRAPVEELERVPGLGPKRAAAIAAERARGGDFLSVDALGERVPGIGPGTVDRIRPHLFAVGPDPACGVGPS